MELKPTLAMVEWERGVATHRAPVPLHVEQKLECVFALSSAEYYLLTVIVAALILIASKRIPPDLVALLVLLSLGFGGVVSSEQALAGFSSPAVITILGLFIITATLERTGVVQWLAKRLAHLSGCHEGRMVMVFMMAGSLLSLVMNNIAAGAVLLPAAVRVAAQGGVRPSRVLMPLAFGTLVGGMATYFTTANIILSSALLHQGQPGLTMLDFLPSGGAMVISATLYMLLIGRRLLPEHESLMRMATQVEPDLRATYQLDERLWEVQVNPTSRLVGKTLSSSSIGERLGVTVMAIWRGKEAKILPPPQEAIERNDILLVLGREERVRALEAEDVHIGRNGTYTLNLSDQSVRLAEVIIAPRSPAIGQTLRGLRFRDKFGLTAVAIWRGTRSYRTDVGTMPLQAGDGLLMVGTPARVHMLAQEPGYIIPGEAPAAPPDPRKGRRAALITALAIAASFTGQVSTAEAVLAGVIALVITGCIRMEEAYRAVEWRVVFLIAGLLPISTAMMSTGLAQELGRTVINLLLPFGPLAIVVGMYLLTVLLTQVMGGQVTALIIGPIAVSTAIQVQINPQAMAVAVAMACSAAFLTPIAHPVNMLMMTPGGYTFGDFLRVGSGMILVCFLTLIAVLALWWGI